MAVGTGPTVSPVQLIQAYAESSFAADMTASLASFTSIPFQEGTATVTLTQDMHDPMHAVQYHHDYREEILGKKSCQLQFTMPLAPTGTAAGQGTAAVQSALGLLLKTAMGGEDLGQGSRAAAVWSSAKAGTVATATQFEKGAAIGWVNTSGKLEARPIANKSGSTLTTKLAFSATPASNSIIYSSATYYLTGDPDSSLNFVVRGLESNDEWVLLGCQLDSISLSIPAPNEGGIPTIQLGFKGVSWLHGDDAVGTFSDISPVTYSNTSPISAHAGEFMFRTTGTAAATAGVTIPISACAFEPQLNYVAVPSPSGTNGVYRWRLSRNNGPSVQGSFTTFYSSDEWWSVRNKDFGSLAYLTMYQIGQAAGGTILIEACRCQITDVQIGDAGGIQSTTVTWKARRDTTVTTATTDLHYSPFRIHFI